MKRQFTLAAIIAVAVILFSAIAFAQLLDNGTISGTVTDQDTGDAIAGAVVKVFTVGSPTSTAKRQGIVAKVKTDEAGCYELQVPYGDYHMQAHKLGYFAEWFEEADHRREGTVVTVGEGNNPSGIDFTLILETE